MYFWREKYSPIPSKKHKKTLPHLISFFSLASARSFDVKIWVPAAVFLLFGAISFVRWPLSIFVELECIPSLMLLYWRRFAVWKSHAGFFKIFNGTTPLLRVGSLFFYSFKFEFSEAAIHPHSSFFSHFYTFNGLVCRGLSGELGVPAPLVGRLLPSMPS